MLFWSWSLIWKIPPMTVAAVLDEHLAAVLADRQGDVLAEARFKATAGSLGR